MVTYNEIIRCIKDNNCLIYILYQDFDNNQKIIDWECACGEPQTTTIAYLLENGECNECMEDFKGKDIELVDKFTAIRSFFRDNNCKLLTRLQNYIGPRKPLKWICKCGRECERSYDYFKDRPMCSICWKNREPNGYEEFCKLLKAENWKMISAKHKYINEKTKLTVKTNNDDRVKASYYNFKRGHRDKISAVNESKLKIEDIKKAFDERGFVLLENKYINNKTPMRYSCKCQNISEITWGNFTKNKIGCNRCVLDSRKTDWNIIIETFEKAGCTLISKQEDYVNRHTLLEYICYCTNSASTSWAAFSKGVRCKGCTVNTRRSTNMKLYGAVNYLASVEGKEKIKQYYEENFGVQHNMQLEECREKGRQTSLKNNGVEYVFATAEIREKAKQAHIDKYGAPPGFVESIREKGRQTCRKNYGVDYPFRSDIIWKRIEEKYGNKVYIHSEQGKKHILEKYGAPHVMQVPEIFEKAKKNAFKPKLYAMPSGSIVSIQGYENICLDMLIYDKKIKESDITVDNSVMPAISYRFEDKARKYYPDIFIMSKKRLIEVKSAYTFEIAEDQNFAKWNATVDSGYDIDVYIYTNKKSKEYIKLKYRKN